MFSRFIKPPLSPYDRGIRKDCEKLNLLKFFYFLSYAIAIMGKLKLNRSGNPKLNLEPFSRWGQSK